MKSMKHLLGVFFLVKLSQISRCGYLLGAGKASLDGVWLSLDELGQPALGQKGKQVHGCLLSLCRVTKPGETGSPEHLKPRLLQSRIQ